MKIPQKHAKFVTLLTRHFRAKYDKIIFSDASMMHIKHLPNGSYDSLEIELQRR